MNLKKTVQDYFKASLDMNSSAMAKDFASDIEIQNIAPSFTRYIYGIEQFKRSGSEEATKAVKQMMEVFDDPKVEISKITEKGDTIEIKISFEGTVNKDLGEKSPYKKGEIVKNESRSVFKFNEQGKIILIQNYLTA